MPTPTARSLLGSRWDVTTLVDGGTADAPASASSKPTGAYLVFSKDEMVGSTGCNGMGGRVTHTSTHLSFAAILSEARGCLDDRAHVERHVLAVIQSGDPVAYHIEGDRLTVDGPDGKGLVLTAHRAKR